MKINYSYLPRQFNNCEPLWKKLKKFVSTGDFTLGKELGIFEKKFAKLIGVKYAVGVNSGTDALKLSLKAIGVKPGDEVITAANTFVATVGAIHEVGAKIKFVDCDDTFCIDTNQIEKSITKKTKAIMPVHFTGSMPNMEKLKKISLKYNIPIIEDACQSILGSYNNKKSGSWGVTAAFSFHPLKNINVWSDGGMIVTNNKKIYSKLLLLRNHGLVNRDTVKILGYNSRLDTFQAVIGNWILPKAKTIAKKRIENAKFYDRSFEDIKEITIPPRIKKVKHVYHLYIVFAKKRDQLYNYCLKKGIEAKIHYPTPIYRQEPFLKAGYKKGMFPVTDSHVKKIISFPCDQHLKNQELKYIVSTIRKFYK
jgi:dTDP-3-amino-2,3,6-trideoxy-4-keto-D-glucose/dTDP-3-amino-3,4,6-trideoxy-alpha-D-glucose/dTDP-2,6-dideoxy-D-kanosamine transaminase